VVVYRRIDRNTDGFPENWKPFHQYSVHRLGYYISIRTCLIQAGRADTGGMADTDTVAYTGRHGGY